MAVSASVSSAAPALLLPVMTSGAEIALISGGWTALVGLAGFGAAVYTNNRTIKSARDARLREWRAEAYVDVLKEAAWQQQQRQAMRQMLRDATARLLPEPTGKPIDYDTIEGRMQAFASTDAFTALQAYSMANRQAEKAFNAWAQGPNKTDNAAPMTAFDEVDAARSALVGQIRSEMNLDRTPLKNWGRPGAPADQAGGT